MTELEDRLRAYREEHGERCEHGRLREERLTVGCAGRPTTCECCASRFCGVASSLSPGMPTRCWECRN